MAIGVIPATEEEEEEETENREKDAVLHNGPTASLFNLLFLLLIPSSENSGEPSSSSPSSSLRFLDLCGRDFDASSFCTDRPLLVITFSLLTKRERGEKKAYIETLRQD